mgnify:CR=1 FL=1
MSKKWFIIAVVFFVLLFMAAFYFHFWGQAEVQRERALGPTPMEIAKQRAQQRVETSQSNRSATSYVVHTNAFSILTYIKYFFLLLITILVVLYFMGYKKIPRFLISKIPKKLRLILGIILIVVFFITDV